MLITRSRVLNDPAVHHVSVSASCVSSRPGLTKYAKPNPLPMKSYHCCCHCGKVMFIIVGLKLLLSSTFDPMNRLKHAHASVVPSRVCFESEPASTEYRLSALQSQRASLRPCEQKTSRSISTTRTNTRRIEHCALSRQATCCA